MKKHFSKIMIGTAVIIILALSYWWGGNVPSQRGRNADKSPSVAEQAKSTETPKTIETDSAKPSNTSNQTKEIKKPDEKSTAQNKPVNKDNKPMTVQEKTELASKVAGDSSSPEPQGSISYSEKNGMNIESNGKDEYRTAPVPEGKPVPVEPKNETITDEKHTCTMSVRCDTILKNIAWLDPEKVEIVPKNGVIFASTQVDFYEGESVFNLLKREMKKNKIHMEFVNTPIYNSAYIEGIANLYEFDCGELSGWLYKVNGWFPNYGCSRYKLKPGDTVEWVYTCDLGNDVGGYFSSGGGQKDE